ncbi:GDSL-type esterase/lipase family protein [Dactylosporangium sp. CA-233914]|uniref:GDSL-type esterase/lipase family protein n=1 Tax=Dactylosporangium sp. CA-233914 TaxID=3239934 RepID=UPI003D8A3D2C
MGKRGWTLLLAGLALLAIACEGAAGAGPGPSSRPSGGLVSMAALGDSITNAFASCLAPSPCPRNSWATGDGTKVGSHYKRLLKDNPGLRGNNHNYAAANARADALAGQASAAVKASPQYVTVLVGADDACRGSLADMTPVETFRRQVDQALAVLREQAPGARVLVASIPDVNRLWEIGHTNTLAVKAWNFGVCPALLAEPTSTAPDVVDRRKAFGARVDAYNEQLAAACRAYGPRCRADGGAVHRVRFTLDMVTAQDFFHPNATGQGALATAAWQGAPTW